MNQLEVTYALDEVAVHVRLAGELDLGVTRKTSSVLHEAVEGAAPPTMVVLDLAGVSYLAAAGARVVLEFADSCAFRGFEVRLVADPDGVVTRVLRLCSRQAMLPVYDSVDAALATGDGPPLRPRFRA